MQDVLKILKFLFAKMWNKDVSRYRLSVTCDLGEWALRLQIMVIILSAVCRNM